MSAARCLLALLPAFAMSGCVVIDPHVAAWFLGVVPVAAAAVLMSIYEKATAAPLAAPAASAAAR